MVDFKYHRNIEEEFFINLKISKALPKNFDPKYIIGMNTFLMWDNNGLDASKIITGNVPVQVYEDLKKFIIKIHELEPGILCHNIEAECNFTIGSYHIFIDTPFICRLQLIELSHFISPRAEQTIPHFFNDKHYEIKHISKEYHDNTNVIEISAYVDAGYDTNQFAKKIYELSSKSFYDDQINCLFKYMYKDGIDIIKSYL